LHKMFADDTLTQDGVPATQRQLTSSLSVKYVQAHQQAMHGSRDHLFSFRSLWDVRIRIRNESPFRPRNQFFWHLFLIISTILLAVLVIVAVLPAFHRQPSPSKSHVQDNYGPASYALTIPPVDPSLQDTAQRLQQAFKAVYPQLVNRFALDPATAPHNVTLTFSSNLSSPVATSGTIVTLNPDWMGHHPTDLGLLTHGLTLVVQQYPSGVPTWFSDGMADYTRYVYGPANDDDWSLPDSLQPQDSYKQGGGVAARFLVWLEQYTRLDIVDQLNHALQTRQSFSSAFHRLTHHTVDELWSQYTGYPVITLLPEQLYKTVTNRKPIFYQSSFHEQAPRPNTQEYSYAQGLYLSNFTIQADITIVHGSEAGIFFRCENDINYSAVFLFPNGTYELVKQNEVVASSSSSAIKQGLNQTNQLTIIVQKHTFYVYINGQFIAQFDDKTSSYGTVGPWVIASTSPTDAWFKNIQVF